MKPSIHPTAIVEPGAQLGDGCVIHAGRHHQGPGAILGERVAVHPTPSWAAIPRSCASTPRRRPGVKVGAGTIIREYVDRSTGPPRRALHTVVGANCLLMACSHVAHDAVVGDNVVIANAVLIAGHVTWATTPCSAAAPPTTSSPGSGRARSSGAFPASPSDIPPFVMAAERDEVAGPQPGRPQAPGRPPRGDQGAEGGLPARLFQGRGTSARSRPEGARAGTFKSAEARRFLEFITTGHARDRAVRAPEASDADGPGVTARQVP
jgi:UDP-N-acetylglucosamine acyltransferase